MTEKNRKKSLSLKGNKNSAIKQTKSSPGLKNVTIQVKRKKIILKNDENTSNNSIKKKEYKVNNINSVEVSSKKAETISHKKISSDSKTPQNDAPNVKKKIKNDMNTDNSIDWYGYEIDDNYVIGYGLDINNLFRELKDVYIKDETK